MNQEEFIIKAQSLNGQELIGFAFEIYGKRAAIGTSLQKTGSVIIDLDETLELFEETQQRYGITIDRLTPDPNDIEDLYKNYGQYPFFSSLGRLRCCEIRKRLPLLKKLLDLDVWISGLRADQSDHRQSSAEKVSIVKMGDIEVIKINPLVDWTQEQIDAYIKDNAVPYNKLYDFESPYGEKFRKRAGKWPWEQSHKECGLHIDGDGI
ncbi:MAG: phosphoadenosine phosphosulfate reductase domain-containing protein [Planctomycetota bacterium]|jgi:phosphoadenosine phosphosulfate reductase